MTGKWTAGAAGVACASVAVAAGQLASAVVDPASAPVVAVGASFVDVTPEPLKAWAIATFGVYDKFALMAGIGVTLTAAAAGFGILARRRPWAGYAGVAGFGLLGAAAAAGRPAATLWWTVPSLAGAACGAFALWTLFRRPPAEPAAALPGRVVDRRGVLAAFALAGLATAAGWRLGGTDEVEDARAAVTLPAPASEGPSAAAHAFDVDGITTYLT
ncbi:MAG: molybdopterin-binding oxidoreductase, partial [Stackebrandtia sp.]